MNLPAVRKATDADREFIAELGKRTIGTSISSVREAPLAFAEAGFERLLEIVFAQSHIALIAEDNSVILRSAAGASRRTERVGFLLMVDTLPDEVTLMPQGFIAYMAVEPEAREQGIGAALLAAAEDEGRKRGLTHVALMVTEENAVARALYQHAGYVTERRLLCKAL